MKIRRIMVLVALCFYLAGVILCYKGYDKMTNYYMGSFSHGADVNAYVGGDAYNYIINSNYATGFYVLSAGCMICGSIFLGTGILSDKIEELKPSSEQDKRELERFDHYFNNPDQPKPTEQQETHLNE